MRRIGRIFCGIVLALCPLQARGQASRGIENPAALGSFFRTLGQVQTSTLPRPVRVVQFGDSHTVCDWFWGPLKSDLERDFGIGSVNYQVFGRNGMRARELLAWMDGWGQKDRALVSAKSADLIILLYGSNEVVDGDWSPESYARMYAGILMRLRRLSPAASILVLGPPDRAVRRPSGWETARRMPLLLEAQRRAAFAIGGAFWNGVDAMGGYGSINLWVASGLGQEDHVHLTRAGYLRLTAMMHYDVVSAFNVFVERINDQSRQASR